MSCSVEGPVLALGATSLIGRRLPPRLPGTMLIGAGRGAAADGYARWVRLDLADPDGAAPACAAVVSLAPIWLLPAALPALLRGGARRVVAVSSTSRWTKAASPDAGERGIARRLAEAEAEVARLCEAAGAAWTVLRPTMIYAEGEDGNVSRLAALAARFGVLPLSGAGGGLRQPVHAEDVAAGVAASLASPAARNRAYDLPGGETLTYADLCRRVFAGLGRRPRLLHVPPPLWRAGLGLASPWLPGATAAMGGRMGEDLVFDPGPAERDLRWRPRPFRPDFRRPAPSSDGRAATTAPPRAGADGV